MELDVSKLRDDLVEYYGTAMHSGLPMAAAELTRSQCASPQELVDMALREGFDPGRCGL